MCSYLHGLKKCPTHYTLLLLIIMVPQTHLRTWLRTLSFTCEVGKPVLSHNGCHRLKGYLCLCYASLPSHSQRRH